MREQAEKIRKLKLQIQKSRVTIHDTIQIQQLLFKFVALFKISGTIQILNMNRRIPLTRWMNHFRRSPLYALFLEIIREHLAIQRAERRFHATIRSSILAI